MKPHFIRLTLGILVALAAVERSGAQGVSLNLTPSIDSVAHETRLRNAGAVAQLLAGGQDPNEVDDGRSALVIATIDDNLQIAQILVKGGARLDDKDQEGNAPLHYAVERNHGDMVQLLLDSGASVDPQNRDGMTPLMLAASRGYFGVVQDLLGKGASPAKTDYTGRDALGWAEDSHQTAIAQLLQRAAVQR